MGRAFITNCHGWTARLQRELLRRSEGKETGHQRSRRNGRLVAGLLGQTHHGWLYVGWLWVSGEQRQQKIGTELMRRAEAEALERGCHHAHLTTLDFQATGFYERLGYKVFGVLDDYPRPHKRFFMQKQLVAFGSPNSPHRSKD